MRLPHKRTRHKSSPVGLGLQAAKGLRPVASVPTKGQTGLALKLNTAFDVLVDLLA